MERNAEKKTVGNNKLINGSLMEEIHILFNDDLVSHLATRNKKTDLHQTLAWMADDDLALR